MRQRHGPTPLCLLLALAAASVGDPQGGLPTHVTSELASLASSGDALRLWQRAASSSAAAVVDALQQHDESKTVRLLGIDLDELRIWHGQSVMLALEADGQAYRFVVSSEPEWKRLAHVLPTQQGGLLPRHDWDSIERDWLNPVSRGSLLPDFALQGPVDVSLSQPTALQLFLPHASDAGVVQRVLLREGAAVMVRGARAVRLRRGLDLQPISLSEFAGIVTSDAKQQQPLGVLHLLEGVRTAAAAHWNASHPAQTLGLVALEIDPSPQGAALLAAPASGAAVGAAGSRPRLRVRKVKDGVIELLPRDGPQAAAGGVETTGDGAVAVPNAQPLGPVWPLTSVHPSQLQSYERLLRQVVSSRLFKAPAPGQAAFRVAHDVQLKLVETEAQATTLLKIKLELDRRPKVGSGAAADEPEGNAAAGKLPPAAQGSSSSHGEQQQQQQAGTKEAKSGLDDPPSAFEVLAKAAQQDGPFEEWTATVQVKGDAQRGTLKFVPLHVERVGAMHDTVQFAPAGLASMARNLNDTMADVLIDLA